MSLFSTLRTGVSGMNAQSNRISTVAENIQNASTTGYKRTSAEFSSLLLDAGNVGNYNSGAVETTLRRSVSEGGPIASTNSDKDLAIQGNGFFVVSDAGGAPYMTRAGNFVVDGKTGNLVNAGGFTLMGYALDSNGTLSPGPTLNGVNSMVPVNLTSSSLKATASTKAVISGNLPIDAPPLAPIGTESIGLYGHLAENTPVLDPNSSIPLGEMYSKKVHVAASDSDGSPIPIDLYITRNGVNEWSFSLYKTDNPSDFPASPIFIRTSDYLRANIPYEASTQTISISDTKSVQFQTYLSFGTYQAPPGGKDEFIANAGTAELPARTPDDYSLKTSLVAFDKLGQKEILDVYMNKRLDGQWDILFYSSDSGNAYPGAADAEQTLRFDDSGKLMSGVITDVALASGAVVKVDLSAVTQLASSYSLQGVVDGTAPMAVTGSEFGSDGTVYAVYSDGTRKAAFKVPLADVASPNNLTPRAGNVFTTSAESGDIQIGFAGQGGRGTLKAGALEQSNVDVSTELTTMIESQTVYTANSKVFMTGNELLETLMNLKR